MSSQAFLPVRKQQTAQPLPHEIRAPGDECNYQNHKIDVFARTAPKGVLDKKTKTIDHHHHFSENDVGPADTECQTHRVPQVGKSHRNQDTPDHIKPCCTQRVGSAQVNIGYGLDGIHHQGQQIDPERHRQKHDLLKLV